MIEEVRMKCRATYERERAVRGLCAVLFDAIGGEIVKM